MTARRSVSWNIGSFVPHRNITHSPSYAFVGHSYLIVSLRRLFVTYLGQHRIASIPKHHDAIRIAKKLSTNEADVDHDASRCVTIPSS
ncbi:hypothetical protein E2C01_072189 [Portunus trituberculatus]|uniref:Uncharacterized protein n=1 Tax=Portunus trituberculatus TaxID=210409 RepID=A0A5B7I6H9_PORTR|nr:hypothetical protein [Portunus trituberculatus]